VVSWGGANRTTTYVSSNKLTAEISAADIATAAKVSVRVFTPAPGGGVSKAKSFKIGQ